MRERWRRYACGEVDPLCRRDEREELVVDGHVS